MAARFNLLIIAALVIVAVAAAAAAVTQAESSDSFDVVHIRFLIEKTVAYGQGIAIAGNITELGNWNVADAPLMSVNGTSTWTLLVDLLPGLWFEFKPVLVVYDTKDLICWSSGKNIVYRVATTASKGTVFLGDFDCDSQDIAIKEVIST